MIRIEKVGSRIHLRSSRPTAKLSGTVAGAVFNKGTVKTGGPYWSMPLSLAGCIALRDRFGQELDVGPVLWQWAKEERKRAASMNALASSADAELVRIPTLAPRLAEAMERRTYQRVGARFIAQGRRVIIGDQPGLGKTLEALGGVVEADCPGPYLVVCPKTAVQSVWAREIPRWLGERHRVVTVPDGREKRDAILNAWLRAGLDERTWVVVHPEMVRTRVWWVCGTCRAETPKKAGKVVLKCGHDGKGHRNRIDHTFPQLFDREWGAIICDESDRALLRPVGSYPQTRCGMEMLPLRADGLKIAMSGTPFRGRPTLLWGTLNWLWPDIYTSSWNWIGTYWMVEDGRWGGKIIGSLGREEELWKSLDPILLRRTKAEVAPDLPPKSYAGTPVYPSDPESPVGVWLEMGPVQAAAYAEMLETSAATLADGERLGAIGVLAELTRLKQLATCFGRVEQTRTGPTLRPELPSNKFDGLVQLLSELGYPDDPQTKVVVASQFTEVLELFAAELPRALQALSAHPRTPVSALVRPRMLTGNVTGGNRTRVIDAMNLPVGQGAHLLMLNIKAGGVAITLDTVDDMAILDETWIPDDQEQLEDRIHRVSRPRPVTYHYFRSTGTIDLGIALVNATREYDTKRLLDGRRGIDYAQKVLATTRGL